MKISTTAILITFALVVAPTLAAEKYINAATELKLIPIQQVLTTAEYEGLKTDTSVLDFYLGMPLSEVNHKFMTSKQRLDNNGIGELRQNVILPDQYKDIGIKSIRLISYGYQDFVNEMSFELTDTHLFSHITQRKLPDVLSTWDRADYYNRNGQSPAEHHRYHIEYGVRYNSGSTSFYYRRHDTLTADERRILDRNMAISEAIKTRDLRKQAGLE